MHGLLGANGAGKSTLSKVISGHVVRDAGEIRYKGRLLNHRSTREALDAGIAIVMQETSLAPDLSVLENIFLPELGRPGRLSYGALRRRAREVLASLGHEHVLGLDEEVSRLSAAQRQLVEIAKALALDADLIIFDEPTASLSPTEVERLFDIMTRLREGGRALVFVSHRLEEVFAITDRVTIMREGRTVVASRDTATLTQSDLIRYMVGQELGAIYATPGTGGPANDKPVAFAVEGLSAPPAVRNVSFQVRRGEILGLGGLVGAGRSETAEAIFGLRPRAGGDDPLDGKRSRPAKADAGGQGGHRLRRRGPARAEHRPRPVGEGESPPRPSRRAPRLRPRLWQPRGEDHRTPAEPRPAGGAPPRRQHAELLGRHAAEDHHRALAAARSRRS